MLPKKELESLAAAMKATPVYKEMAKLRSRIMSDPKLGRSMMSFEQDYARIMNSDFTEEQIEAQMKRLYDSRKNFFETGEVKAYMKTAQDYHKLVSECVAYLNGLLEVQ